MKILVADDDPIVRFALRGSLEKMGHAVVECDNGQEVLGKLFSGDLPQLLVLDWMMPDVDGLHVCRVLRERRDLPFVYIMMLTGRSSPADIVEGLRSGANDYLVKPVQSSEFQARIQIAQQLIESSNLLAQQRLAMLGSVRMASLGEMATSLAHEINNPLAVIMAQAESIADRVHGAPIGLDLKQELDRSLASISEKVHRVSRVIHALRAFSRGDERENPRVVPVSEIFEHVEALCGARLRNEGVDLIVKPFSEKAALMARPNQIVQALLNLIDNSVYATAQNKEKWIELEVFDDPKHVYISVRDNGKGIPVDIRNRIMEPFFTTRDIGSGLGLGLSVARGYVTAHGGSLRLDEGDARTRFVMTLPKG